MYKNISNKSLSSVQTFNKLLDNELAIHLKTTSMLIKPKLAHPGKVSKRVAIVPVGN